MAKPQSIKLTKLPQMFDINKNFINFKSHLHVICANPFKAAIISQSQIDNPKIDSNKFLIDIKTQNEAQMYQFHDTINVDINSKFEQYYLMLKCDKESDAEISIETFKGNKSAELIKREQKYHEQQQEQAEYQAKMNEAQKRKEEEDNKPLLQKLFTLKNILYCLIIICICALIYVYFFNKSDSEDKSSVDKSINNDDTSENLNSSTKHEMKNGPTSDMQRPQNPRRFESSRNQEYEPSKYRKTNPEQKVSFGKSTDKYDKLKRFLNKDD